MKRARVAIAGVVLVFLSAALWVLNQRPDVTTPSGNGLEAGISTRAAPGVNADAPSGNNSDLGWASKPSEQIDSEFHDTKNRAEAGDPVAQRRLAQMYQQCMIYSVSPEKWLATLDEFAKMKPQNAPRLGVIKRRLKHYCDSIDSGQPIPFEALELWYAEAARRGDTIAKLRVASNPLAPQSPKVYSDLIGEAVASGDPEVILAAGEMLSGAPSGIDLSAYGIQLDGNNSAYAWHLAACRSGANCGQNSSYMDDVCMGSGACDASDIEDLIRHYLVPPGQFELLDKEAERIRAIAFPKK